MPLGWGVSKSNERNKLLYFTYNVAKLIHSHASADEYWAILNDTQENHLHLALISFPLCEYLYFSGASEETFELVVPGLGFKYESICRLDNDFVEVVYHLNGSIWCIQKNIGNSTIILQMTI
jgi:hypothetical protein